MHRKIKGATHLRPITHQIVLLFAHGEMVEWSITAVLKTAVLRGTGGSNPSLSANSKAKSAASQQLVTDLVLYTYKTTIQIVHMTHVGTGAGDSSSDLPWNDNDKDKFRRQKLKNRGLCKLKDYLPLHLGHPLPFNNP